MASNSSPQPSSSSSSIKQESPNKKSSHKGFWSKFKSNAKKSPFSTPVVAPNLNITSISKVNRFYYDLTIDNFLSLHYEAVNSEPFGCSDSKFTISLYPKAAENPDHVAVYAGLVQGSQLGFCATFSIIDSSGNKLFTKCFCVKESKQGESWGLKTFLQRSFLNINTSGNKLLADGKLTIRCEILTFPLTSLEDIEKPLQLITKKWLHDESLSDVILTASDKEWPAHKFVLASHSPVFDELFEKEKEIARLELSDVEPEVVDKFLEYVYTEDNDQNGFDSLNKFATKLLPVADKFKMSYFKKMCEKSLCSQLSSTNVLEYYKLSQKHNVPILQARSLEFMRQKLLEISQSDEQMNISVFRNLIINISSPLHANDQSFSFKHTWKIENFAFLLEESNQKDTAVLCSCPFGTQPQEAVIHYFLQLKPYHNIGKNKRVITLELVPLNKCPNVKVTCKLSFLNVNGTPYWTKKIVSTSNQKSQLWIVDRSKVKNHAKELLLNNALTVKCEVKLCIKPYLPAETCSPCKPTDKSEVWRPNEKLSDVRLVVGGGVEFQAHKLVLAEMSPVFEAMFRNQMKENLESKVELNYVSPKVFGHLLEYFYTRKVSAMDRFALDLLALADKFQVDSLKTLCEQYLISNLSNNSSPNTLYSSLIYNTPNFKVKALPFIKDKTPSIIEATFDSQCLLKTFHNLTTEINQRQQQMYKISDYNYSWPDEK